MTFNDFLDSDLDFYSMLQLHDCCIGML